MSSSDAEAKASSPESSQPDSVASLIESIAAQIDLSPFACGGSVSIKSDQDGKAMSSSTDQDTSAASSSKPQDVPVATTSEAQNAPSASTSKVQDAPTTSTSKVQAIPTPIKPVQIRFGHDGEGRVAELPVSPDSDGAFQALLASCTPASFGRNQEEVYNNEYRQASKLDTTDFVTSFCPYEAGIIDVVAQMLLPGSTTRARGVRAELYKLNIYSGPNGKFKSHVDTPRSETQFGSLVVCLPFAHSGGQLVVQHKGKEMTFDWSQPAPSTAEATRATEDSNQPKSRDTPSPARVHWAAFYSDCLHEVQEVHSGHRVTLTYNLYISAGNGVLAGQPSALDPAQLLFYSEMQTALQNPLFFQDGHVLAIGLAHAYAHSSENSRDLLPFSLKGSDMYLYEACKALGLLCFLRPVIIQEPDYDSEGESNAIFVGNEMHGYFEGYEVEEGFSIRHELGRMWPSSLVDKCKVQWLRGLGHEEAALGFITYGNQPSVATAYSAAAIFVVIPPFKDRSQRSSHKRDLAKFLEEDDKCMCGEEEDY